MQQPLDGVKILDATQYLAGPHATMILADMGAEVVKIERPGQGDFSREIDPFVGDMSCYYLTINRNKQSVTLNLTSEKGREIFLELTEKVDVVVENFRPGTMEKFGLDYDTVSQRNDEIIYCSISGFGQTGPYKNYSATDPIVQAFTGSMSVTGPENGKPYRVGFPVGDISGSMYAVQSILAALYHHERTGDGQYIDVSLTDGLLAWVAIRSTYVFGANELPNRGNNPRRVAPPFGVFETEDSRIFIAVIRNHFWEKLCNAIDRPELVDDERFDTMEARRENEEEVDRIVAEILQQRTTDEWFDVLSSYNIISSPINDLKSVWEDEHIQHRDLLTEVDIDGTNYPLVDYPVKFSEWSTDVKSKPPDLGEHTEDVLQSIGYSDRQISELQDAEII